jgi:hypothetical protein
MKSNSNDDTENNWNFISTNGGQEFQQGSAKSAIRCLNWDKSLTCPAGKTES